MKLTGTIGERLAKLRAKSGLSLRDVAAEAGTGYAHIWEIEAGRHGNPTLTTLLRLAAVYDIPIHELVRGL